MVYIKLTPEMWIVSGLEKVVNSAAIIIIGSDRYLPYQQFKTSALIVGQPIHSLIKREHVIPNIKMKQLQKENELTPAQKQHRQELKIKHQLRLLNPTNTNPSTYYFETKKDESIKDISASISFGMTFIFSFFMAGLTGYYFGVYFLGFEMTHSLIVSVVFIMATIIIQTALFIIKQNRDDRLKKAKAQQKYKDQFKRKPTQFDRSKQIFKNHGSEITKQGIRANINIKGEGSQSKKNQQTHQQNQNISKQNAESNKNKDKIKAE